MKDLDERPLCPPPSFSRGKAVSPLSAQSVADDTNACRFCSSAANGSLVAQSSC